MLRIGSGLAGSGFSAQASLRNVTAQFAQATTRLATLKRINRGSDDPAGLIAAEALRKELNAAQKLSDSADRARRMAHAADSALSQTNELLNGIRANVVAAGNSTTTDEERAALQLEIDAALDALDRIGNTTKTSGVKLFDGETTIRVGTSNDAVVALPEVNSSSLGTDLQSLTELRSSGDASLSTGDLSQSLEVLDAAQDQILWTRGSIGSFERTTIDSSQAVASRMIENLSQAKSQIVDADIYAETVNLARSQTLTKSTLLALSLGLDAQEGHLGVLFDMHR